MFIRFHTSSPFRLLPSLTPITCFRVFLPSHNLLSNHACKHAHVTNQSSFLFIHLFLEINYFLFIQSNIKIYQFSAGEEEMKSRRRDEVVQFCRENTLLVMTMFSVFLGVVLGFGLRPLNLSQETLQLINFPGEIFMQVLKMMILPLIFSSLISGEYFLFNMKLNFSFSALAQMDAKESGQMGASTVLYYLSTAILATLVRKNERDSVFLYSISNF
ncbi:hypothetical protein CRE_30573 [Caenorhabditis remanei]|uniref:Amino acid transporter n=1 Tax=Caenorhabditis remanei TaxID=31234 RepID=E3NPS5_CAERE|nr:hypothetical protein CRE_30573 [Caenorhabditis remanei]